MKKVLVVASTFPAHKNDPVPTFVKDQIIAMKKDDPENIFFVLAPHDKRSDTKSYSKHETYDEYRFHYMWPRRLERLAGQGGIVPSIKKNPWLYLLIPFFIISQFLAVLKLSYKIKPDVINAHWIIPQGFVCILAGIITRIKVISTVHGGDVFTFNNSLALLIKRLVLRRSSEVVANSSATRKRCIEIYNKRTYKVVPMGVDLDRFSINTNKSSNKPSPLKILFVGRLSEEKGVNYLLEALSIFRSQGNNFIAKIVGSGPEEKELRSLSIKLGLSDNDVKFIGWVDHREIVSYYLNSDIFIGPSIESKTGWIEALGVVFIEAAAAGLPTISTSTGGISDIVIDNETGFLVKQRSAIEIANSLNNLKDYKLRQIFGKNARKHIEHNFLWSSVAHRYNSIINQTVNNTANNNL